MFIVKVYNVCSICPNSIPFTRACSPYNENEEEGFDFHSVVIGIPFSLSRENVLLKHKGGGFVHKGNVGTLFKMSHALYIG